MTKCFSTVGEEKDIRSTTLFPVAHQSKDYINQYGILLHATCLAQILRSYHARSFPPGDLERR